MRIAQLENQLKLSNLMVEVKQQGDWHFTVAEAKLTRNVETFGKMDPYTIIKVQGVDFRTKTMDDAGKNPVWNQSFDLRIYDSNQTVNLEVWDAGSISDEIVGSAEAKLSQLLAAAEQSIEIFHKGKSAGHLILKSVWKIDTTADKAAKLESMLKEKDEEIEKLKQDLKKSEMEKKLARSLMDKVQAQVKDDIEKVKKEVASAEAQKLVGVQNEHQKELKAKEQLFAKLKETQEKELKDEKARAEQKREKDLEMVKKVKDSEAKLKCDELNKVIAQEKKNVSDKEAAVKKIEQDALSKQASL